MFRKSTLNNKKGINIIPLLLMVVVFLIGLSSVKADDYYTTVLGGGNYVTNGKDAVLTCYSEKLENLEAGDVVEYKFSYAYILGGTQYSLGGFSSSNTYVVSKSEYVGSRYYLCEIEVTRTHGSALWYSPRSAYDWTVVTYKETADISLDYQINMGFTGTTSDTLRTGYTVDFSKNFSVELYFKPTISALTKYPVLISASDSNGFSVTGYGSQSGTGPGGTTIYYSYYFDIGIRGATKRSRVVYESSDTDVGVDMTLDYNGSTADYTFKKYISGTLSQTRTDTISNISGTGTTSEMRVGGPYSGSSSNVDPITIEKFKIINHYAYNASGYTLPTPSKDGYTFLGWYTAPTGGELVTSYDASADTELYAHWAPASTLSGVYITANNTGSTVYDPTSAQRKALLTCQPSINYNDNSTILYSFGYTEIVSLNPTVWTGTPSNWTEFSSTNTLEIMKGDYLGGRRYYCRAMATDGIYSTEIFESNDQTYESSRYVQELITNAQITFHAGTGTISGTGTNYAPFYIKYGDSNIYDSELSTTPIATPTATRTGAIFTGWFTGSTNGTKVIDVDGTVTPNINGLTNANGEFIKTSSSGSLNAQYILADPATPTITGSATKIYNSTDTVLTCDTTSTYEQTVTLYYQFGFATSDGDTFITWLGSASTDKTLTISKTEYFGQRWYSCRVYAREGSSYSNTVASATTADAEVSYINSTILFTNSPGTIIGDNPLYSRYGADSFYTGETNSTVALIPYGEMAGHTFNGWYTAANGGDQVITAAGSLNANVSGWTDENARFIRTAALSSLYPQYTANIYSITLNNQGADSAGTTKLWYQYNTTKQINGETCYYYLDSSLTQCLSGTRITTPTKAGYYFAGYYPTGGGLPYISNDGYFATPVYQKDPYEVDVYSPDEIVLTANWERIQIKVTLPDGTEENYYYGASYTLGTNNENLSGSTLATITFNYQDNETPNENHDVVEVYHADGWLVNGVEYADNSILILTEDITIAYNYEDDPAIENPEFPQPSYYGDLEFAGWYTAPTGGEEVTSSDEILSNITLYAHWARYYQYCIKGYCEQIEAGTTVTLPEDDDGNQYSEQSLNFRFNYNYDRDDDDAANEPSAVSQELYYYGVFQGFFNSYYYDSSNITLYYPDQEYVVNADTEFIGYYTLELDETSYVGEPTRDGFRFLGWYTDPIDGVRYDVEVLDEYSSDYWNYYDSEINAVPLYAHWLEVDEDTEVIVNWDDEIMIYDKGTVIDLDREENKEYDESVAVIRVNISKSGYADKIGEITKHGTRTSYLINDESHIATGNYTLTENTTIVSQYTEVITYPDMDDYLVPGVVGFTNSNGVEVDSFEGSESLCPEFDPGRPRLCELYFNAVWETIDVYSEGEYYNSIEKGTHTVYDALNSGLFENVDSYLIFDYNVGNDNNYQDKKVAFNTYNMNGYIIINNVRYEMYEYYDYQTDVYSYYHPDRNSYVSSHYLFDDYSFAYDDHYDVGIQREVSNQQYYLEGWYTEPNGQGNKLDLTESGFDPSILTSDAHDYNVGQRVYANWVAVPSSVQVTIDSDAPYAQTTGTNVLIPVGKEVSTTKASETFNITFDYNNQAHTTVVREATKSYTFDHYTVDGVGSYQRNDSYDFYHDTLIESVYNIEYDYPEYPEVDSPVFKGWYTKPVGGLQIDEDGLNEDNFIITNNLIDDDFTLYAQYYEGNSEGKVHVMYGDEEYYVLVGTPITIDFDQIVNDTITLKLVYGYDYPTKLLHYNIENELNSIYVSSRSNDYYVNNNDVIIATEDMEITPFYNTNVTDDFEGYSAYEWDIDMVVTDDDGTKLRLNNWYTKYDQNSTLCVGRGCLENYTDPSSHEYWIYLDQIQWDLKEEMDNSYVYAYFVKDYVTITYWDTVEDQEVYSDSLYSGSLLSNSLYVPQEKSGYVFGGWYTDTTYTERMLDFNRVYDNITLYSRWIQDTRESANQCIVTRPDNTTLILNAGETYQLGVNNTLKASDVLSTITFKYQDGVTSDTTGEALLNHNPNGWYLINQDEVRSSYADEATYTCQDAGVTIVAAYEDEYESPVFPEPTKEGYTFKGWFKTSEGGKRVNRYTKEEDINLYAQWSVMEITVTLPDGTEETYSYGDSYTFETNDVAKASENVATITFKYQDNETADTELNVVKSFTPNGWLVGATEYEDNEVLILTEDIEIEYNYTETLTSPVFPEPTRSGYEFAGWFDAEENGNEVTEYTGLVDINLYAYWTENDVTVTLPDGTEETYNYGYSYTFGTNATPKANENVATITFKYQDNETADTTGTVIKSYTPNGWLVGETEYADGAILVLTENIELEYNYNETITNPSFPEPTRTGYMFDGWYDSTEWVDKITEDSVITDDVSLYAHWIEDIRENENQCIIVKPDETTVLINKGETYNLGENNIARATEDVATVTFKYQDNETADTTGKVTRTYTPNAWLVNDQEYADNSDYTCNSDMAVIRTNYTEELVSPVFPEPTREHYEFDGWFNAEENGSIVTTYTGSEDINLYAYWSEVELTVTLPDGTEETYHYGDSYTLGTNATPKADENGAAITFKYQDNETADTVDYVVKSYTPAGWLVDGVEYVDGASVVLTDDTIVEYNYTETLTNPTFPEPTRPDYMFDGWYTDTNYETKVTEESVITENINLYAHWIEDIRENENQCIIVKPDETTVLINKGETYNLGANDIARSSEDVATVTFKYQDGETADTTGKVTRVYTPAGWLVNDIEYADNLDYTCDSDMAVIRARYTDELVSPIFPEPTRDNYDFDGWFDAEENGSLVESYAEDEDINLYAYWTILAPTDFDVDTNELTLLVGGTHQIVPTFVPAGTTDTLVYSEYDNEKVSVVDGLITGLAAGETTIKVSLTSDNTIYKTISVTIISNELLSGSLSVQTMPLGRIVIGEEPQTALEDFLSKIDNPSEYIKVYDSNNELVEDTTEFAKTGMKIKLVINDEVIDEAYVVVRGDLDGDGYVDASDGIIHQNIILEKPEYDGYKLDYRAYAADLDYDPNETEEIIIDATDGNILDNKILEKIDSLNH